ncbi:hypothetical protein WJX74_007252 [Apatococcus lobatus]|uniref:Rubredoxin-like domain-containing protein n=1 Tax=Apatococcus lobatus TaxID=904363 RepID=A0AAW1S3S8_9CHLO
MTCQSLSKLASSGCETCQLQTRTQRTKHSSCSTRCNAAPRKTLVVRKPQQLIQHSLLSRRTVLCRVSTEQEGTTGQEKGAELQNDDSDSARKQREADQLRAAEKFMVVGTGEAECTSCGFIYDPRKGDPEYPVGPGTQFSNLPGDWQCPICGAGKRSFQNKAKTLAGFEQNMQYGFGTNTMTSGQKSLLIYGSLIAFFGLFLFGYLLQ